MQTCMNAQLMCIFGTSPSQLMPTPKTTMTNNKLAANVMDFVPMTNILPFGACITPTNPQVAAATAAALGVLTPQPCIPVTTAPWTPGSLTVMVDNALALNNTSVLMCQWGGVISIVDPGQTNHMIA
jgi:hypothetical protein